jgi:PAS domain S-box-containing protein/putative nucleotidyltransferase with HDIG domain
MEKKPDSEISAIFQKPPPSMPLHNKSGNKYYDFLKNIHDGCFELDLTGKFVFFNDSVCRITGYSSDDLMEMSYREYTDEKTAKKVFKEYNKVFTTGEPSHGFSWSITRKDGTARYIETSVSLQKDLDGKPIGFIGIVNDVTERRRSEELLKQSEEKYRLLAEHTKDGVWITDLNLKVTYISPSIAKLLGWTVEEIEQLPLDKRFTPASLKKAIDFYSVELPKALAASPDYTLEKTLDLEFVAKDGHTVWVECMFSLIRDKNGDPLSILGEGRDITERKQMEEAMRYSEEKFKLAFQNSPNAMSLSRLRDGRYEDVNDAYANGLGYERDELIGRTSSDINLWVDTADRDAIIRKIMENGKVADHELRYRHRNGDIRWGITSASIIQIGQESYLLTQNQDITEKILIEKALREKENIFQGITHNLPGIIFQFYAKDTGEYGISYLSEPMAEFAEIILKEEKENLDAVFPEFFSRIHKDDQERFLESIKSVTETMNRWNFEGRVFIRSGKMIWFQGLSIPTRLEDRVIFDGIILNITERKQAEARQKQSEEKYRLLADNLTDAIFTMDMNLNYTYASPSIYNIVGYTAEEGMNMNVAQTVEPETLQWFAEIFADEMETEKRPDRDLKRSRVLEYQHIRKDGTKVWVETKLSFLRDEKNTAVGMIGVLRDITERKQAEENLQKTMESLRKAVGTTIQVLVSALEARDPYTSGHQSRVANLARTIATEMGLVHDKIEGIRMAGTIHDIGKLSIPAEILTKPTKLTNLEFSLIKEHSKIGYEMLKDVESPWNLAEIVHQHHERMNGSGYPRKLKGNEILLEARILAVADVVEAMATHRPYRPSLGIAAALDEIEKNKGILYDANVADACLKLFKEKNYQLA